MSNVSSSKSLTQLQLRSPYVLASLVIIGAITLFLLGQFLGVILLFIGGVFSGVEPARMESLLDDSGLVQFLAAVCIQAVTVGLVWSLLQLRQRSFKTFFGLNRLPKKKDVALAAVGYILYYYTFITLVPIVSFLIPALNVDQTQDLGIASPQGIELVFVFFSLVIFPSIVEEIVFRGILFKGLKKYIGIAAAIVISSIIFGAAHLEFFSDAPLNWIAAVDTTVFAVFLSAVYVRSGSLWPPILLHAIKNSIAFVVLFIF